MKKFALTHDNQLKRSRLEAHDSFIFEHNIVYFTKGHVWTETWTGNRAILHNNLYFGPACKKLLFGGMTFKQWQTRGLDINSIISDPKLTNPAKDDFRLRKTSTAFRIGFIDFHLSDVGPRL